MDPLKGCSSEHIYKKIKVKVDGETRKLRVCKGRVLEDLEMTLGTIKRVVYNDEDNDEISAYTEDELSDAIFNDNISLLSVILSRSNEAKDDQISADTFQQEFSQETSANLDTAQDVEKEDNVDNSETKTNNSDIDALEDREIEENEVKHLCEKLSTLHETDFGYKCVFTPMKKDGLWYVHCHLCDVEIMKQDKGKGLFTYKSHLKSAVHKANVFAIMGPANGRQANTTLAEDVEMAELSAQRFIESQAPNELKLTDGEDGKMIIKCKICFPVMQFNLFRRPTYQVCLKSHITGEQHRTKLEEFKRSGMKRQATLNFASAKHK